MLTHDSIFKVISPSTEASLEVSSVDLLFNLLGSFFLFLATHELQELYHWRVQRLSIFGFGSIQ
jgi:hypothetical protein